MPHTHVDSNCNRTLSPYVTDEPHAPIWFANTDVLEPAEHLHDPPRYILAERHRISSTSYINSEEVEHSECNRERVVVARCPLRHALRAFCRKLFF